MSRSREECAQDEEIDKAVLSHLFCSIFTANKKIHGERDIEKICQV